MPSAFLVAYATRYGSTREVAEAIAATLRESGLEVGLAAMRDVRTLAGYGAAVLGAPLYMARWHRDALRFLSQHYPILRQLPVAVFALGPWHDEEKEWREVRAQLDRELLRFPWLKPRAVAVFGGRFDPARLTFPHNLVPGLKQMPPSDIRDWQAIRDWAGRLARELLLAEGGPAGPAVGPSGERKVP